MVAGRFRRNRNKPNFPWLVAFCSLVAEDGYSFTIETLVLIQTPLLSVVIYICVIY